MTSQKTQAEIKAMIERFKVKGQSIGMTRDEQRRAEAVYMGLEKVVKHPEFRRRIESFSWTSWEQVGRWPRRRWVSKQILNFRWTYNYGDYRYHNRSEVFYEILESKERHQTDTDFEADIFWQIDRDFVAGVLGYTYPGDRTIYTYKWWFSDRSTRLSYLMGHVMHEQMHHLNYDHAFNPEWVNGVDIRNFTVPYAVGFIAEEVAELIGLDFTI